MTIEFLHYINETKSIRLKAQQVSAEIDQQASLPCIQASKDFGAKRRFFCRNVFRGRQEGKMQKHGAKGDTFYGKKYSPNSILMIHGRKMVELRNYSTANVGQVS